MIFTLVVATASAFAGYVLGSFQSVYWLFDHCHRVLRMRVLSESMAEDGAQKKLAKRAKGRLEKLDSKPQEIDFRSFRAAMIEAMKHVVRRMLS